MDDRTCYIANEIEEYLFQHPDAADTIDGIAKWWLTRQQYEHSYETVSMAVEYLLAQGKISKCSQGRKAVYKLKGNQNL